MVLLIGFVRSGATEQRLFVADAIASPRRNKVSLLAVLKNDFALRLVSPLPEKAFFFGSLSGCCS